MSNVYSGGTVVIRNGTSWAATSSDFAFQTYVLTPILDQSETVYDIHEGSIDECPLAQYFTAHVTGLLTHVSLLLDQDDEPTADPTVQIYTVPSATVLGSTLLGSASIPLSSIPGYTYPAWLNVNFSGVNVTAGNQYSIVLGETGPGTIDWYASDSGAYSGGYALFFDHGSWHLSLLFGSQEDMAFKTYVLPVPQSLETSPYGITPCSNGVCPGASGGFNPADLTGGVKSTFQFQERPNGTVQGILNFNDPRPDGITLRGCTTESAHCALTVTTLACTSPQLMTVGGTFTPRGGTATNYMLTMTQAPGGPGTFFLTAGDYTYKMTFNGIVNLTCPSSPTVRGP